MDHRMAIAAIAFAIAGVVLTSLSAIALGSVKAAEKWPSAPKPKIARPIALIGAILGLTLWIGGVGLTIWFAVPADVSTMLRGVYSGTGVVIAAAAGIYSCTKVSSQVELRELIELPDRPASPPPVPVSATRYAQPDDINGSADPSPQQIGPALPPGVPEYEPQSPAPVDPQQRPGPFLPDGTEVTVSPPPPPPNYEPPQVKQQPAGPWSENAPTFTPHRDEDVPDHEPEPQSPAQAMPEPTVAEVMHDAEPGWVYIDEHDNYFAAVSQSNGGVGLLSLTDFTVIPAENHPGPLSLVGSVEATVWPMDAEDETASETETDNNEQAADSPDTAENLDADHHQESREEPGVATQPENPSPPPEDAIDAGEPPRVITPPLNIGKAHQTPPAQAPEDSTDSADETSSQGFELLEPEDSTRADPDHVPAEEPDEGDPRPQQRMPHQQENTPGSGGQREQRRENDVANPGFTDYRSR